MFISLCYAALAALTSALPLPQLAAPRAPIHLIAMLMDDFGWANVGYHRTHSDDPDHEVRTPNIDALVATGVQLNRFYTHKFCSPTRSALQSGRSPIFVNVQNSDIAQFNPADPVSGFQGIPRNVTGLATKLRSAGYATHMVGKCVSTNSASACGAQTPLSPRSLATPRALCPPPSPPPIQVARGHGHPRPHAKGPRLRYQPFIL